MNGKIIKSQLVNVPFSASSANGMTEYYGIAKFSPAGIVFEFESKLLGLVGGEVKEVRVALEEIFDIRFRKGIYKFFAQIQLRLKNFTKLSQLPNESGKIKLNIKRADYDFARAAVEQTLQYMNDGEPPALQSDVNTVEQPPVQTSVNELFDTQELDKKSN